MICQAMVAYAAVSCRSASRLVRPMHSPIPSLWRPENRLIDKQLRHQHVLVGSALALLTSVSPHQAVNPHKHSTLILHYDMHIDLDYKSMQAPSH